MSSNDLAPDRCEYVVVGSGAGGGTVAARLAEAGKRVVLLEAGGDPRKLSGGDLVQPDANRLPVDYDVPAFHAFASENEAMKWDFYVRHYADDAASRLDCKYREEVNGQRVDGILYPRAGTLGGCTAHNAMICVYPHNNDWDSIAELTHDASWKSPNMRRYFERFENCRYRPWSRVLSKFGLNPTRHGWNGWLHTEEALPLKAFCDPELAETIFCSWREAIKEEGHPLEHLLWLAEGLMDPNDWRLVCDRAVGLRFTPLCTKNHQRIGTRERLLEVARCHPDRLTIVLNALATKVLLDENKRAIGVEYLRGERLYRAHGRPSDAPGERRTILASREIILAGGAFNTPQLLMLSGIGPPDTLQRHGIPTRIALSGVGKNLQDRYEVAVVNRMKEPWGAFKGATFAPGDPQFSSWQANRSGVYTSNGSVFTVFRKSPVSQSDPDLFCMSLLARFSGYYPNYSREFVDHLDYLSWVVLKAHTRNRAGEVTLRSADPRDTPLVNFNYFAEGGEEDMDAILDGVRFVRRLTAAVNQKREIMEEELPGKNCRSDEALKAFVRSNAWGHHASCTCPIGTPEKNGVLSSDFKVHGASDLRVVDASVFPQIPGFFILSSIFMIAEKAADVILADAQARQ